IARVLRGKKIPFTEDNIRRHLGIHGDSPDAEVDDEFVALAKAYERGDDMDMAEIFLVIGQEGTNWANNPASNAIPNYRMAQDHHGQHGSQDSWDQLWHEACSPNLCVDDSGGEPSAHDEGHPIGSPDKAPPQPLPYPVFISRLARRYEVPEFLNDAFYNVREVDMYVPFGDWRGERARGPVRPHRQPPPQDQPAEPLPQPEKSATPSAPAQYSFEPTMHDVMRRLDRQDRQIARTQAMIRHAFPSVDFTGLGFSSSYDDGGESQGV
ncbi:hypothetical protein PIB30_096762, partial [Stylosanthes scabra]|nr:hypothetical protein [Stylosanthes scabra]